MSVEPAPETPPAPPRRSSGVVVPHAPKWHQRLLALVIWLLISAVTKTIRFRLRDEHGFLLRTDTGPKIFCFWHNRLVLCMELYARFRKPQFMAPGAAGLVSASKDGALLAAIFERFGVHAVRGSSSRRGAQALRELATWGERGYDLAITPDGPRGPRYLMAEGVTGLAQITNLPVVPVSYYLKWKIRLPSWDGLQIPLPFSVCEVAAGRVFHIPPEMSDAEREQLRQQLEAELRAITRD
ncbi:MAG: lysophospholipid acyltransferase family protein [Verrucomicrobiota bacterium]